jgi:pimeloyl-ACP methyl ester carboxylesterase
MATGRLILFPGLGAGARMYAPLAAYVGPIIVPPWLPPGGDLRDYARRYVEQGTVRADDWLGGCSFGGMVAQEIAAIAPVRAVILIGSCRSAADISRPLRRLAPLARIVPMPRHPRALASWPLALAFGAHRPEHRRLLMALAADIDPRFLRWASQVAARWPGTRPGTSPIHQIHGGRDRIMPAGRTRAEVILPGAGHLLAVTHAAEVGRWLNQMRRTQEATHAR